MNKRTKKYIIGEIKKGLQLSNRILLSIIVLMWVNAGVILGFIYWLDYVSPTMKIY